METRGERLVFIDGLRGIAASAVVLCHLASRTSGEWIFKYGFLGVSIFFVLSGFVIAMSVADRAISLGFLGRFAARRSIRLDPPYWLSILTAILLMVLAAKIGVAKQFPSANDVLAHLLYAQDLIGVNAISEVYWTLCFEVQFYLFLILVLWSGQAARTKVGSLAFQAALFVLMTLSLIENANILDVTPRGVFLPYWFAFSLGAMTYWAIVGRMSRHYLFSAVLLVSIFAFAEHGDWCVVAAVTSLVIYAAHKFRMMGSWLSGSAWQFLGKISYSLYLFHPLVGWAAMSVALRFVGPWASMCVGIVTSLMSAWIVYHLVERQSIKASHWVKLEKESIAPDIPALRV